MHFGYVNIDSYLNIIDGQFIYMIALKVLMIMSLIFFF